MKFKYSVQNVVVMMVVLGLAFGQLPLFAAFAHTEAPAPAVAAQPQTSTVTLAPVTAARSSTVAMISAADCISVGGVVANLVQGSTGLNLNQPAGCFGGVLLGKALTQQFLQVSVGEYSPQVAVLPTAPIAIGVPVAVSPAPTNAVAAIPAPGIYIALLLLALGVLAQRLAARVSRIIRFLSGQHLHFLCVQRC
jgi:outer membrane lipoprotein SlyB